MRGILIALSAIEIILGFAGRAFAGTTGALSGYVVDGSGRRYSGAEVRLYSLPYAGSELTVSDRDGHFAFVSVAPGFYIVGTSYSGGSPTTGDRLGCSSAVVDADTTTYV